MELKIILINMKSKKINNGYIIRLEKNEEIIESLTKFCEENNIKFGSIAGIGGTNAVSLNYYDLKKGKYITKKFSGKNFEIISLNGNISILNNKPFAHIHIVLGDSDYKTFGGHLVSAIIGITAEITISMIEKKAIKRKLDNEFKLNFLDI